MNPVLEAKMLGDEYGILLRRCRTLSDQTGPDINEEFWYCSGWMDELLERLRGLPGYAATLHNEFSAQARKRMNYTR